MSITTLLSVPPAAATAHRIDPDDPVFATSDPPGRQLGSGGGTAHLLHEAWKASGIPSFRDWLASGRKLIIHGSGQSRRLPAYAAEGKLRLPLPPLGTLVGQSPAATLLDLQRTDYGRLFRHAPDSYCLMVTCGDALVRADGGIPRVPEADVLVVGLPAAPEEARNHGVLFATESGELDFFLQKPSAARIVELSAQRTATLDTGVWLLSLRAVEALMRKSGWDSATETFRDGAVQPYELYDKFGLALGATPSAPDPDLAGLTSAVLPLPDGRFYHFGTNRSVFGSIEQLSHPAESRRSFGHAAGSSQTDKVVLHSTVLARTDSAFPLWIENSSIPASWNLAGAHVLTGIPDNAWTLSLPRGACLDVFPVKDADGACAFRIYGFDDVFKGAVGDPGTLWMGQPAAAWFKAHGIDPAAAGIDPSCDIQKAPLFPVLPLDAPQLGAFLQWLLTADRNAPPSFRERWLSARRVSASDLLLLADIPAREAAREARIQAALASRTLDDWARDALTLDLEQTARRIARFSKPETPKSREPEIPKSGKHPSLSSVHLAMLRDRIADLAPSAPRPDASPYALLRDLMLADDSLRNARPRRNVLDDQIVWGRSPARLDLAGGWSDTPPYCLEHGGCVVNVGVDLNGQPPIQAFGRVAAEPRIVLHSIDLGISETIETYEDLVQPSALGGFSVARAALRLAGFDPAFHADGGYASLREHLKKEFGGGLELSMLAAIPKGSGLGTSSILSGTILGVLGELCDLGWSQNDLYARTSAVEQLLTSGGGWQDQIGGLAPGLKLVTTRPGLAQTPEIRWLPDNLLRDASASGCALLYYTGLTRVARNILSEIVRGIFLNDRARISVIEEIAANAVFAAEVVQHHDWPGLQEAIRRSWRLNQALDPGTNPPGVQAILDRVAHWNPASKLLGAGGGGYLLMLADDPAAAAAIRAALRDDPPNPRARFVTPSVSSTGLQITRS